MRLIIFSVICLLGCIGCKSTYTPNHRVINDDSVLLTAFIGIKVVDLDKGKVLFSKNEKHLFTPASNTKLLTMTACINTFGDSIAGWNIAESENMIFLDPQGDPTFMMDEFKDQKLFEKLSRTKKDIKIILPEKSSVERFGSGWSWGIWQQTYAPERSMMPIYGNMVNFLVDGQKLYTVPTYFSNSILNKDSLEKLKPYISVLRNEQNNNFYLVKNTVRNRLSRPFTTNGSNHLSFELLKDTLQKVNPGIKLSRLEKSPPHLTWKKFNTIPTDILLGAMMKRSDNFFAEQILLMVSKERLGYFSNREIIEDISKNTIPNVLGNSQWADGSGLSRNNLISPEAYIKLLKFIYNSPYFERIKQILPSSNQGTLKGLYIGYENQIWAKTGTLSNHLALSGFIRTNTNKNLAFSFLINNHRGDASEFKQRISNFLIKYIEKY